MRPQVERQWWSKWPAACHVGGGGGCDCARVRDAAGSEYRFVSTICPCLLLAVEGNGGGRLGLPHSLLPSLLSPLTPGTSIPARPLRGCVSEPHGPRILPFGPSLPRLKPQASYPFILVLLSMMQSRFRPTSSTSFHPLPRDLPFPPLLQLRCAPYEMRLPVSRPTNRPADLPVRRAPCPARTLVGGVMVSTRGCRVVTVAGGDSADGATDGGDGGNNNGGVGRVTGLP